MTPAELKNEILTGPLAASLAAPWAAGNDTESARLLNVRQYTGYVPIRELSAYCLTQGITGTVLALDTVPIGVEFAAGVPMTLQIKVLLKTVVTLVQADYRLEEVDVSEPAFVAALDGLAALELLSVAQRAAVVAMGSNRRSRAEVLGWTVTADDIGRARNNG